jgi:hypothetical protein
MNETIEYLRPDQPSQRVSESLAAWLARPEWELAEAYNWLQGCYLPPVGYDDEPFEWMCRGLLLSPERPEAEVELARRMAQVLAERPDVTRPGTRPDQLLYNLFMLCAGLHRPAELGAPLYEIFARRKVRGEWLDVDLRAVLTTALIANQADQRLLPVWQTMLAGQADDFLIGDETDGLDGVTLMPAAGPEPAEPALAEIGKALQEMTGHLCEDRERRPEFSYYLNRIMHTFPGRPKWNAELIWLAHENHWPDWAVVSLPSLYVPLDYLAAEQQRRLLLWEIFLPIINELGFTPEVDQYLCDDKVVLLRLPEEAIASATPLISILERRRLEIPLPTYSAVLGAITDAISETIVLLKRLRLKDAANYPETGHEIYLVRELWHWKERADAKSPEDILTGVQRKLLQRNNVGVMTANAT